MERREFLALAIVGMILLGLPAVVLGYQYWLRPTLAPGRVIDIEAAIPENGGLQPDAIEVQVGETVTLRFASLDVTHGIAIGPGLSIDLGHIDPGEVKEITLTFDKPGVYTYYCNSWCSPNHWRMRGVIQVVDPAQSLYVPQLDPVIEALIAEGVDIDAKHSADTSHASPMVIQPSISRGATLAETLVKPAELDDIEWRRTHTPAQAVDLLAATNPGVTQAELVDVVFYWWSSSPPNAVAQELYAKNCAACHGETGGGDGPAADTTVEKPVAFADAVYMFERRSDVFYAKIRRGGMGTDMPNFGTIFTPEETWALVDYLWSFPVAEPTD